VLCLQNHDQVGNRGLGDRLGALTSPEDLLVASAVLLFAPGTPLLFMGQEWNASTPFLFFSDHDGDLGNAVREGRRKEFASFAAFSDPEARARIPDPQAAATFERSKLRWSEREEPAHARFLATTRALVALRKTDPVLSMASSWSDVEASAKDGVLEVVRRHAGATRRLLASFADAPVRIDLAADARVLLTVGELHGSNLGAKSAVVVDR
jgi:maltooligosyltrehalose trehalohydrolase